MNYKNFNLQIIIWLIGLFMFNILLNIAVDPFYIFKTPIIHGFNEIKPDLKKQERLTKVLEYKLNKNNINAIFFGSSRVDYSIDASYYKHIAGQNAFNFGIKATGITETANYIKYIVKKDSKLKNIYVGVDFFGFGTPVYESKKDSDNLYYSSSISLNELATVLISQDALMSSITTLMYNIKQNYDIDFNFNGLKREKNDANAYDDAMYEMGLYINKDVFYKHFRLCEKRFDALREIKKICKENKLNVIFFVNPINVAQLQAIKATNNLENYRLWKEKIADITPFYDFSGYNFITTESLSKNMKYYFDSNHYKEITGNLIVKTLFTKKPDKFGVLINTNNVKKYNELLEKKHNEWIKNNPTLVKEINSLKDW